MTEATGTPRLRAARATVAAMLLAVLSATAAQSLPPAQEAATIVHRFEADYAGAWNTADAQRLTALFADDVTIHTVSGQLLHGRAPILADTIARYRAHPHPPAMTNITVAAEWITDDVIATQGRSEWADGSRFIYTKILRRDPAGWRLVAMQQGRPAPMALTP